MIDVKQQYYHLHEINSWLSCQNLGFHNKIREEFISFVVAVAIVAVILAKVVTHKTLAKLYKKIQREAYQTHTHTHIYIYEKTVREEHEKRATISKNREYAFWLEKRY